MCLELHHNHFASILSYTGKHSYEIVNIQMCIENIVVRLLFEVKEYGCRKHTYVKNENR